MRKIMVVTGASSGIGFCTAMKAQEHGFDVVWASRNIEKDEKALAACRGASVCRDLDVGSEEAVNAFFAFVDERFGRLDALVNCAGFVDPESMLTTSLENWEKTLRVNLTGTFLS